MRLWNAIFTSSSSVDRRQRRVLAYARELEQPHAGGSLLSLAGSTSRVEATEMQKMLEREFERVDLSN